MNKTEVMILGTIHGLHKDNEYYSYDHVFSMVDAFEPDVIGLEIRKEDLLESRPYLTKYYPYEMIECKYRYQETCKVHGFDWLGETIEGKLIPQGYFENLKSKVLEKDFQVDENFTKEKQLIDIIDQVRYPLVLKRSGKEVNDGRYDVAVEILYQQLESLLRETPYEEMSTFHRKRDEGIEKNIIEIVKKYPGKKIIFLTGIDHRVFALKALKSTFKDEIIIREI